jgi:hypothetical protein
LDAEHAVDNAEHAHVEVAVHLRPDLARSMVSPKLWVADDLGRKAQELGHCHRVEAIELVEVVNGLFRSDAVKDHLLSPLSSS